MNINKKKKLTALLSIISNVFLTLLKLAAGVISGSLSIISEAIHSVCDLLGSLLTFYSVVKSSKPADADHPYGHGKYEDMSGFIEGFLIMAAGVFILYEAVSRIVLNVTVAAENTIGIIVMMTAFLMNIFVSYMLFKVAKETNSISLYADGEHLRTDVYSSLGVLVGLVLIKLTGYVVLDSIVAILVAAFIFRKGYSISKKTLKRLLDYSLPDNDMENIKQIINKFSDFVKLKENSVKARQVGPSIDIDIILQFPDDTTICKCHKICDEVEKQLQIAYPNSFISIHSEPICYKINCVVVCKNCN